MPPADPSIAALWTQLRPNPAAADLWQQLAQAYAAAGLLPQQAYAAQQLRRLQPSASSSAEAGAPAPGTPAASAAEALLLQPQLPVAQAWATALAAWLKACPGDWLSWLYCARLADSASDLASSGSRAQGPSLQQAVDLEGNEPLEAAKDLSLTLPLGRSPLGVSLGGRIPSQAVQRNAEKQLYH